MVHSTLSVGPADPARIHKAIIIDTFSGISAVAAAMDKLRDRFQIIKFYSFEVDNNAVKVAQARIKDMYPGVPHQAWGDIQNATPFFCNQIIKEMEGNDIIVVLTGGSPCQDLSSAGVREDGREREHIQGRRSSLFFHLPRILFW
jgi:site-specific DNA-cytosine methylase